MSGSSSEEESEEPPAKKTPGKYKVSLFIWHKCKYRRYYTVHRVIDAYHTIQQTLKMTSAGVVEMSFTNNSSFQDYSTCTLTWAIPQDELDAYHSVSYKCLSSPHVGLPYKKGKVLVIPYMGYNCGFGIQPSKGAQRETLRYILGY